MSRRSVRRLLVVALVVLSSGCGVRMPTSGGIVEAGPVEATEAAPGMAIDPRPPREAASATQVVQGFLDAMLATPLQTRTAELYLSQDAQAAWNPGLATITYAEKSPPQGSGPVTVELSGADRLDARGAWLGALASGASTLRFPMVRERGEWRIAAAPNALIVPESWFQTRYVQQSLYWFDQSGRILVPEPVFVPRGTQLATSLVRDLVRGPGPQMAGTARTFLPAGAGEGLSVPVDSSGTAQVALTSGAEQAPTTPQSLTLLRAQLAWTLRQDPAVRTIRLSVAGRDVPMPDGRARFSVDEGSEYDPGGYQTNPRLFALREGVLVSGPAGDLEPVGGPFGSATRRLSSFAVDLWADTVAGVTGDGRGLVLGPVRGSGAVRRVVRGAARLLRPAWDAQRRLWLVDATAAGAAVSFLSTDRVRHPVRVPGVSGADVRRFLVSRDGARLVALVHTATGDEVVASRLRADDVGEVAGAGGADVISAPDDRTTGIQDIAWASPTEVLLLHRLSASSQIRRVSVDGSGSGLPMSAITVGDVVDGLLGSPLGSQVDYALSGRRMLALGATAPDVTLVEALAGLSYVG